MSKKFIGICLAFWVGVNFTPFWGTINILSYFSLSYECEGDNLLLVDWKLSTTTIPVISNLKLVVWLYLMSRHSKAKNLINSPWFTILFSVQDIKPEKFGFSIYSDNLLLIVKTWFLKEKKA